MTRQLGARLGLFGVGCRVWFHYKQLLRENIPFLVLEMIYKAEKTTGIGDPTFSTSTQKEID